MTGSGFWPAYTSVFPIGPLYQDRKQFYQLIMCFEFARNMPHHLMDTNRLCRRFGLPAVGQF